MTTATLAPATDSRQFLPLRAAAGRFGISAKTLRRWITAGRIQGYQPSRTLLVKVAEVEALIEACATAD
jgi:excisionase family DNA binding protein